MTGFQLTLFELTQSFPLSARILYKNIGLLATVKVFVLFAVRKLTYRPFKKIASAQPIGQAEALSRHQLYPVLLLDEIFASHLKNAPG